MGYKDKNDQGDIPGYGAIFMSNTGTKKECFQRKLLGLPLSQSNFVLHVKKGMILFLFEFEKRQLHGVFRATSDGEIDIEPNAFKSSGKFFPAQVRFTHVWKCYPLAEHEFMDAIRDNYFSGKKFKFGLSKDQVYKLITLFHSKKIPKKPTEGDTRFGDNRRNIRDRIRFVNEEDGHDFDFDEVKVKEIDNQGYRSVMEERKQKDNKERFLLTNYMTQKSDDFGKISVSSNDESFLIDKNKYYRDDNRTQDDYHVINGYLQSQSQRIDDGGYYGHETVERQQRMLTEQGQRQRIDDGGYFGHETVEREQRILTEQSQSQRIDDGGYFGHETVLREQRKLSEQSQSQRIDDGGYFGHETLEREQRMLNEQRRLTEHSPYEPRGTDYGIKLGSNDDFAPTTHNSLSHYNPNNSDFIPIPEVSEQYKHPFEYNNMENTYEHRYPISTSYDLSKITIHTPYDPEVPDFIHKPYDPEVPEFCHKPSYFAPGPCSNPTDDRPIYTNETIPNHSENKDSEFGKFRNKNYVRKVSVFDRLTKAPKAVKHEQEHESDEKDDLDESVNKVMKMLEKIVRSPIKRTEKRKSRFKQDDDNITTSSKIVDYELLNIESDVVNMEYEGIEGDESIIEETRVVDFKRRKKTIKNLDDESKECGTEGGTGCGTESEVGKRRKKLVRPVFVEKESTVVNENENAPLKVDCYLTKTVESVENIEGQKGSIEGEVCAQVEEKGNGEKCIVLEKQPQEKGVFDDVARVELSKEDDKMCGWIEG